MIPTPYLLIAKIVAAAALLATVFGAGWHVKARFDAATIADMKSQTEQRIIEAQRVAEQAEEDARATEQRRQLAVDAARKEIDDAHAQTAATAAALDRARVTADGLRGQLATYAAGPRGVSGDTLAACDARATALAAALADGAELLDRGRRLFVGAAQDADDRRAEVNALVAAWPH